MFFLLFKAKKNIWIFFKNKKLYLNTKGSYYTKASVLGMTQNYYWLEGFISGVHGGVEYPLIIVTPSVNPCLDSICESNLFKNHLYLIGIQDTI